MPKITGSIVRRRDQGTRPRARLDPFEEYLKEVE